MKLSKHLTQIFWDVEPTALNPKQNGQFIVARVAEKGTWADVQWLKKQFGVSFIKKAVSNSRNTSAKTKNFWKII